MNPNQQEQSPYQQTPQENKPRLPFTIVYNNFVIILIFLVGVCLGAYAMLLFKNSVSPSQKITVQGVGTAAVPATDATIDLRISQNREQYQAQIFTLVEELKKRGIPKDSIALRYFKGGGVNHVDKVTVKLHKDNIERVNEVLNFIYSYFPKPKSNESVPYVEYSYALDPKQINLNDFKEQAREQALNDAFKNAKAIAERSGGKVGKAIAVEDSTDYSDEPTPDEDGLIYPEYSDDKIIQFSAEYEVTYMEQ